MKQILTDALWGDLAGKVAAAHRLTEAETARFKANRTARLVAAIPYAADCEEPQRSALAHLSIFLLSSSEACRKDFDHKKEDDGNPLRRLAPIADFQGGDKAVIAEGMKRLALAMLNGYEKDRGKDKASGEYNPLNAGTWDYEKTKATLSAPSAVATAELDAVSAKEESLAGFFWES